MVSSGMVVPGVGRQESDTPRQPPRVGSDARRVRHTLNGTTTIPNFPHFFFVALTLSGEGSYGDRPERRRMRETHPRGPLRFTAPLPLVGHRLIRPAPARRQRVDPTKKPKAHRLGLSQNQASM